MSISRRRTLGLMMVLAAALATATPTLAQGGARFGLFFGDEAEDFFDPPILCMTNSQIRRAISDRGYTDVALNVPNDGRIQVRAVRDGATYLIAFDYCRNRVIEVDRLR